MTTGRKNSLCKNKNRQFQSDRGLICFSEGKNPFEEKGGLFENVHRDIL